LLVAAAVLASAATLYAIARETSMFAIRKVEVTGAPPPLAKEVDGVLARFEGRSLVSLNGAAVVATVENLPGVISATYDRAFPHRLTVRVVPERADAVLRTGVSAWLVSARGRVVASVGRERYPALPRIWLPPGVQIKPGAFLADDAGAAARALRSFLSAGFSRRALWARIHDGQLTVALRSGLELRFGSATDVALKLAVAQSILTTLPSPRAGGPQYLDVSVPERPVAGSHSQVGG
jgi:cell division septal protein FtsQ